MKKLLTLLLACWLSVSALFAYEWPSKPNDQLFRDMITFATQFASDAAGTPAEKLIKDFIRKQEDKFQSDPNAWVEDCYRFVDKLEKMYPPCVDDGSQKALIRRDILMLVDYPVHVDNISDYATADDKKAFEIGRDNYRARARKKAFEWLKKTKVKPGELALFKVYNMGFLVRTSKRTFAIDLCWHGDKAESERLAKELDVVFVTHPHGDHYTDVMMQAMVDKGKIVFCSDKRIGKTIKDNPLKIVKWEDVVETPLDIAGIQVQMLGAFQYKDIPCNLYHLTFDGWTIVHSGDGQDKPRTMRLGELTPPDVLISASWNSLKRYNNAIKACPGADPSKILFIPSHENEFGHRVQQRESYYELLNRKDRLGDPEFEYLPVELMDIGEGIILKK